MSDLIDVPMITRYFTKDGRVVDIDTADADDLRECVRYLSAEVESWRRMHQGAMQMFDTMRRLKR